MLEHHSNPYKVDISCVRRMFIISVQLVLFTSYSSLTWFCEAHAPLHRIYYGPHRNNPSLSSSPQSPSSSISIPSSLISSLASSSSPTIDLSLFGNRFIDPRSPSSLSSEANHDRSENDLHSHLTNPVNSIPSCNQLKYLWKEANRLAINLYGPDFAFSHPKLHANPFYLTNLLLRKHHHTHSFGGGSAGEGSQKGIFIEPESIPSRVYLSKPIYGTFDANAKGVNEFDGFDYNKDRSGSIIAIGQPSEEYVSKDGQEGEFIDDSLPKNQLGVEVYGKIVGSPDQLHHPISTATSMNSPKAGQSVSSSPKPPSSLLSTSSSSTASRKDAKHSRLGFGNFVPNSNEKYDSNPDDHLVPEYSNSKKGDQQFMEVWHDAPITLS